MAKIQGQAVIILIVFCLLGAICYYSGQKLGSLMNTSEDDRGRREVSLQVQPSRDRRGRSFENYVSSAFEKKWVNNVKTWEDGGQGVCSHVMEDWDSFSLWLDATRTHGNVMQEKIFSFLEWNKGNRRVREPIEPLVGILRDPRRPCAKMDHENIEGKDYIVPRGMAGRQVAIFDFGASVWTTAEQGTKLSSQAWFYETYRKFGFQRFACWEATPKTHSEIMQGVPSDVAGVFEYTNRPVTLDKGLDHPWTIVRNHCKYNSSSFIVVKLDIDHPATELPLINELMADEALQDCIDEFFFEHHTTIADMKLWWQNDVSGKLADTYDIMLKLRKRGMRAHVWP
jgi:hypothetical protein